MGCRTGFYLILRDSITRQQTLELVRNAFKYIAAFEGEIPGNKPEECGNYLEHDLAQAKKDAKEYNEVLKNITAEDFDY